jgi:Tfp pilus assembly protein PilF
VATQLLQKAAATATGGHVELARGELLLRQYHPTDAIPELEKAVEVFPNDPNVNALLGDAYAMQGERSSQQKAKASYGKALRLEKGNPRALIGTAELALMGTNISRAKRSIDDALEVADDERLTDSLRARTHVLRGRYHFEIKGDSAASRDHLVKALDVDENLAEAHLSLGFVYEDQSRSREACQHFRRYLELAEKGNRLDNNEARRGQRDNCR